MNRRSTRKPQFAVLLAAFALATAIPAATAAQTTPGFDAANFQPVPSQETGIGVVERPDVLPHLSPSAGIFFHFADDPVQVVDARRRDRVIERLVDERYTADLGAAIGLFDRLEVGVGFPVVLRQTGGNFSAVDGGDANVGGSAAGTAVGDLRGTAKLAILEAERTGGFGLSASGTVFVPTGTPGSLTSDGAVRALPRLALGWRHSAGWEVAGNVGMEFGPGVSVANYREIRPLQWGFAGLVPVPDLPVAAFATAWGSHSTAPGAGGQADPIEVGGGARIDLPANLRLQVGGGAGVSDGVGAPDVRLFVAVDWTDIRHDADDDGVADRRDECPETPEDRDGYEDSDGCPDPDNDGDGLPDDKDECPDEKGPRKNDGCPVADRDGDGIPDKKDECPKSPEDRDGYQDSDGCPDPDNDGDGIPDKEDECPDRPETRNGVEDEDGCPDQSEAKARVEEQEIEITEKIHFESEKAVIKAESYDVLRDIARILEKYEQITLVVVEGHTDSRGPKRYNKQLSAARADAVKQFLTNLGISAKRLKSLGRGSSQPIAPNDTPEGRAKNRRVEFKITEIDERPVEEDEKILPDPSESSKRDADETEETDDTETDENETDED